MVPGAKLDERAARFLFLRGAPGKRGGFVTTAGPNSVRVRPLLHSHPIARLLGLQSAVRGRMQPKAQACRKVDGARARESESQSSLHMSRM